MNTPTQLEVLSPRGSLPETADFAGTSPLADLNGRKIGILNNTKSGGDLLLPYVLEVLRKQAPEMEVREWRIPFMLDPEEKAPRLAELAEWADGVIALTGD